MAVTIVWKKPEPDPYVKKEREALAALHSFAAPGPWKLVPNPEWDEAFDILDKNGRVVDLAVSKRDGEFIVGAKNNLDAVLDAFKTLEAAHKAVVQDTPIILDKPVSVPSLPPPEAMHGAADGFPGEDFPVTEATGSTH